MSYKVKSLVYFLCFLTSAFIYYNLDSYDPLEDNNREIVELDQKHNTFKKVMRIK